MAETNETPPLSYIYGYVKPGDYFKGWYKFYARSDGNVATSSNFDGLIQAFVEHLNRPENKNRIAMHHNQNPDAFTTEQIAKIETLLKKHNEEVSGLAAEVVAK